MPNKTVGTNPLFSSRGANKVTPVKTTGQSTKKVKRVSSNSINGDSKLSTRKIK